MSRENSMAATEEASEMIILVVDDEPTNLDLLDRLLTGDGHNVRLATSGELALKFVQSHTVALILMDIRMPGLDGFEVCNRLKANPDTVDIPIIFISALDVIKEKVRAFKIGGVDYITKPFQGAEVLARVRTHLAVWEMKHRLEKIVAEQTRDLRHSQEKLFAIVENFEGLVLTCDSDFRITYSNPALRAYAGYEVLGRLCHEVLFGESAGNPWRDDILAPGQVSKVELENPMDGRWYHSIHSLILDKNNQVSERQIILYDITERIQALQELQEREEFLRNENIRLRTFLSERYRFGDIIGKSKVMQAVYETIIDAAGTDASVIIYGESGTGKELVAKAIHQNSERKDRPMVYVNCSAIPEHLIESEFFGYVKGAFTGADINKIGYLALADGGTLFLDEIGDIPLNAQVKLLRAIEGNGYMPVGGTELKSPDFRVIAATNRDLKELVREGRMRRDFLYRIHIISITIPPLRERREDIRLLIEHFMARYEPKDTPSLTGKIRGVMLSYNWPGNVRELENTIQCFVTTGKFHLIGMDFVESSEEDALANISFKTENRPFCTILEELERQIILQALEKYDWHQGRTAQHLQLPPRTFYRKMQKLGIKKHTK